MKPSSTPYFVRTMANALNYGDRGPKVRDFQDALRKVVDSSVGVDGIYGSQTEQFVGKAYVKFNSPGISGGVTPDLYAKVMSAAMASPNSAIPDPVVTGRLVNTVDKNMLTPVSAVVSDGMPMGVKVALGLAAVGTLFLVLKK